MKKLIITFLLGSYLFSGITFNKGVVFGDLDQDNVSVASAMGVDIDLNDSMSLGWDTELGMLVKADGPKGVSIRLGFMDPNTATIGVGYNWWSGGEVLKTTIGTSIDYSTAGGSGGNDEMGLRLNVSWGF